MESLSKYELLDIFGLWLLDKYSNRSTDDLFEIMVKASEIISDNEDFYYYANMEYQSLLQACLIKLGTNHV